MRSKRIGAQEVKQGECAWLTGQGVTYTIAFFAFTEPPVVDYFPKVALFQKNIFCSQAFLEM